MILGMTDPMTNPVKHRMYVDYVLRCLPGVSLRILSYPSVFPGDAEGCDGLLLTGGVDVDPACYGREDARTLVEEPDVRRDTFEITLIRTAVQRKVPILGVCRGTQIFNVAMGGTLVPDLERAGYRRHTTRQGEEQRHHVVSIEDGTLLRGIVGTGSGEVSTYHHQAVDRVAPGLRVSARSDDGVVEALEWERSAGAGFLVLVQWHPERMGADDPLAKSLLVSLGESMTQGG
jgi:putative glutamine amidotransferase